jgi:hypothetical protein
MALSHSPQIVRDGLVLYLDAANTKSYPATGSIIYNLNNSLETSTLINGPTFTTLNKGEIFLDGINDFIRIDNSVTNQNLSPATATFDIWIKPDNTGYSINNRSSPISRGNYNTSGGFFIHLRYTSAPSIEASFSNSTTNSYSFQGPTTTVAPAWNEWINLVITVNSVISIYSNGIFRASSNRSVSNIVYGNGNINTNGDTNLILCSGLSYVPTIDQGFSGTWRPYKGGMSSFKMYNRALTLAEIKQNFEATRGRYGI